MNDPLTQTVLDTDDAERFLADEAPEVELVDEQIQAWWASLDLPALDEDLHEMARIHTFSR